MSIKFFFTVKNTLLKASNLVIIGMAMLVMFVTTASAAQQNRVIIGDDYKFITLPEGATYRKCERKCERDTKCRAWTFIRERVKHNKGFSFNFGNGLSLNLGDRHERIIPAQCRLKHSVGQKVKNDCCVSGVVRDMDENDRGEEDRCSRLASVAVRQNDKNLAKRCRYRGRSWHSDYGRHFDRCMARGSDRFKRESRSRRSELNECRSSRGSRYSNQWCKNIADMMVSLNRTNRVKQCGFRGSSWSQDFDAAYRTCRRTSQSASGRYLSKHRSKIERCINRGGGSFNEDCDNYANAAISQQRKNLKNGCGFAGSRWHKNYSRHYQKCRKLSKWRRKREDKARTNSLKSCVRDTGNRRRVCDRYVEQAIKDQRRNERLGCKFTRKTRWHSNRERHYRICRDLSDRERRQEIRVKENALDKCERQHSQNDVKDSFCRDYANAAIDQNRENIRLRCFMTGTLWSDAYRDHYAWCLRNRDSVSKRDRRTRRDKLKECRVEGDVGRGYNWKRSRGGKSGSGGDSKSNRSTGKSIVDKFRRR